MKRLILGTAGHIDHGKTALIKALTGVDTDRLPEEKKRGITIDLGFANLTIGDLSLGIVDVPGHEDLVRNMLAGATGMDAVLLVVAADEGVMPQTREHVAILDLLGVASCVVALTKSDLVNEDWVELVREDVRELIASTSLANAQIVAVSSVTGAGLDELRAAIVHAVEDCAERADGDAFRLPIDRVFTVRGTGTVVTGTVWSGALSVENFVEIQPAGVRARVRGIQLHGVAAERASAGARAAIALSGLEKTEIARGDVVVNENLWTPATMLTVQTRVIAGTDWTLQSRQRIHIHLGTAEVLARVVVLGGEEIQAKEQGWVQLRLERPLMARVGDRVVFRSYSPVETIGGGIVASVDTHKRTRISEQDAALLTEALNGSADAAIRLAGRSGIEAKRLRLAVGASAQSPTEAVVQIGARYYSRDVAHDAVTLLLSTADALHDENPLKPFVSRAELLERGAMGAPELAAWALEAALQDGEFEANGSGIKRKGFAPRMTAKQIEAKASIARALKDAGLAPPSVSELGPVHARTEEVVHLLRLLENEGEVVGLGPELWIDRGALESAIQATVSQLAGTGELAASAFRVTLPVSRKHLIPLLEYLDRTGITRRDGDLRTVLPASHGN